MTTKVLSANADNVDVEAVTNDMATHGYKLLEMVRADKFLILYFEDPVK